MTSWITEHKADITFLVSVLAGAGLIIGGFFTASESTMLLGAGIVGVPGFAAVTAPK